MGRALEGRDGLAAVPDARSRCSSSGRPGSTPSASGARASAGSSARSRSSACITLIFALGTGHQFTTYGLAPTAIVLTRGLHRSAARELRRASRATCSSSPGVRRRAILVGDGREPRAAAAGRSARAAAASTTTSSARSRRPTDGAGLPLLGGLDGAAGGARDARRRRADRHRLGLRRPSSSSRSSSRRTGAASRCVSRRRATELLIERRGEYVPGPGRPALRAAAAGLRRRRLGGQAGFDLRQRARRRRRPAALAR